MRNGAGSVCRRSRRKTLARAVSAALAIGLAAPAGAGFPATVQLSSLDGTNGFMLDGETASDFSGRSVSAAGDVNGDGLDDLIIGAYFADPNGNSKSGRSYVVFGRTSGFSAQFPLSTLDGSNGFKLDGEAAYDRSGKSVAAAGDLNGDGLDDLIVGAFGAEPNGTYSGRSYVVFGKTGGFASPLQLSSLDGTNGFKLDGEAVDDRSGVSVAAAGDLNGDGLDDLIVGAYGAPNGGFSGRSYVVFGNTGGFASLLQLSSLDGTNGFKLDGEATGHKSGRSVAAAGDVNGDGLDDLIVGADRAAHNGIYSGRSYVVFGRDIPGGDPAFPAAFQLSSLDGNTGFKLDGEATFDYTGRSVSAAGDVNGDGVDDLIVGAPEADPNGFFSSGRSYVVFGKDTATEGNFPSSLPLSALDGTNGFQLDGEAAGDFSGVSVAAAGDLNGDGLDDLIVGAYLADPNGSLSGRSYVVFGKTGGFASPLPLSSLDGTNGFKLDGEAAGDYSGRSVSAAGDLNGDGVDDVIVGAFRADPNGSNSGRSYVVFGVQAPVVTVNPTSGLTTTEGGGTDAFTVVLNAQPSADVTIPLASDGTSEGMVSPAGLTFTSANWNTPQIVTVTGVDDAVDDGDIGYTIVTAAAVSADGNFNGFDPADVAVTNQDDDVAGVTVAPTSGLTTTESGGEDTFTVVLDSEPTADVTVALSSSDPGEGTVSLASLTFTSANWNVAQTVTVTGQDDNAVDGDQAYTIQVGPVTSADGNFSALDPADVAVTNTDQDVASLMLNPAVLGFGNVGVGQTSAAQMVTLENTGTIALNLGLLGLSGANAGDFALLNDNCSSQPIAPSNTCTFDVNFTPADTGARTAQVDVPSDAPSSPDGVALSGTGIQPAAVVLMPTRLDFGNQTIAIPSDPLTLTVMSTGTAPLNVDDVAVTGSAAADYQVVADDCTGMIVASGLSCDVQVRFLPQTTGTKLANLTVSTNASTSPDKAKLVGSGITVDGVFSDSGE